MQGRVGSKAKQALAELAALRRSGTKRVDTFEVEEETPVYDVVDEEQYAKIVKKRRDEGGEVDGPVCLGLVCWLSILKLYLELLSRF